MAQPLFGEDMTKSSIAQRRKLANALIAEATKYEASPHWATAVAKGLQGLVGGYQNAQADANEASRNQAIADALAGGMDPEQLGLASGDIDMGDVIRNRLAQKVAEMRNAPEQAKYGLNPIWAKRGDKWELYQGSDAGGPPQQMQFPAGVTPQPQVQQLNTGTGYQAVETRGGAPVGQPIPIDNAGKARETDIGQAGAKAAVDLPTIETDAEFMLGTINSLKDHPGKKWGMGDAVRGAMPPIYGDQADFVAKDAQLRGQAFLQAYNRLRGAGQIANQEGQAATQAILGLSRATSEEDYNRQLGIVEQFVGRAVEAARQRATLGAPSGGAPDPMEGRTITNRATGERMIRRNGQWEPM